MFYSIDLFLMTFLILCYVERKGRLPAKKEAMIAGITFFSALAVKCLILLTMDHHLLKFLTPDAPKSHLSEAEAKVEAVLIWSGTLFAPVWGPYFYAVQAYRAKYDPDFTMRDFDNISKRNCERSNFDFGDLSSDCFAHLQALQDSSDQANKNVALELTLIAIDYLNTLSKADDFVCNKMASFARFYREINMREKYVEITIGDCLERSCGCNAINIFEFDLSVDEIKYVVEQQKIDLVRAFNRKELSDVDIKNRLRRVNIKNLDAAKVLIKKQAPEGDLVAIEYLKYVLESDIDPEIIKDQLTEANELMSTITKKTDSTDPQ